MTRDEILNRLTEAQRQIKSLQDSQDTVYETVLKETGLAEGGWLIDYLLNGIGTAESALDKTVQHEIGSAAYKSPRLTLWLTDTCLAVSPPAAQTADVEESRPKKEATNVLE